MDKAEHGERLSQALDARHMEREVVADYLEVSVRTVTNWRSGKTMPSGAERARLRELLGDYDAPGDAVERAIKASGLESFRQSRVLAAYQEALHEERHKSAM